MSRQRWSLILILIFAVVLAACQPTEAPTPTPRPPATAVPPTEEVVGEATEAPTSEATEAATEVATEVGTAATEAVTEAAPIGEATEIATEAAPATEEATVEATEAPTEEVTAAVGNVIEVAAQAGDFSTLLAAIDAAGLTETLEGSGPFTIFAPTDAAFSAMIDLAGISQADLLANTNLADVLRYHVVAGAITADDLEQYRTTDNPDEIVVPTLLAGKNLIITFSDAGGVIVNGMANVTVANVEASNGIIHVIDTVLVPPADEVATEEATETTTEVMITTEAPTEEATVMEAATEAATEETAVMAATEAASVEATEEAMVEATAAPTEEATPEVGNVIEVATQAGDFTTLLAAIDAAGLTDTLEGTGPFTIFAPTDEAFAALEETLGIDEAALLAHPDLGSVLLYHVYAGDLSLDDLAAFQSAEEPDGYVIPTAEGESLIITFDEDGVATINGVAKVTLANVDASNGVIYVIDAVLLPSVFNAQTTESP